MSADDVWNFNQNGTLMRDRVQGTDEAANAARDAARRAEALLGDPVSVQDGQAATDVPTRLAYMALRQSEQQAQLDRIEAKLDALGK